MLLEEEDAFTGGLGVEALVGLVGLLQAPAVREDSFQSDLVVGDEARAVEHAHGAEGPRADERDLAPQEIGAYVEGDVAAFADVASGAPGFHATHRCPARRGGAGAIESEIGALAPG